MKNGILRPAITAALATLAWIMSPSVSVAATYYYTGPTFTLVSGVYTTSMSISGFLTYNSPLGSNIDVFSKPGSDFGLLDFSFSDGLHTITRTNATDWGISIA